MLYVGKSTPSLPNICIDNTYIFYNQHIYKGDNSQWVIVDNDLQTLAYFLAAPRCACSSVYQLYEKPVGFNWKNSSFTGEISDHQFVYQIANGRLTGKRPAN